MLELRLGKGRVTLVDDVDYKWARHHLWSISGNPEKGEYAIATLRGRQQRLHRVIMDAPDHLVVDHINGDTLDNRRANLRVCTRQENSRNRRSSKPGYKGVEKKGNTFRVAIMFNRKHMKVGCFRSEIAAARAYDLAAIEHHGEYAALNFSADRDWIFACDLSPTERSVRATARVRGEIA